MPIAEALATLDDLARRYPPPKPPFEHMPAYQRLRMAGRSALMAAGLAWTERQGLMKRSMPELTFLRHVIPAGSIAVDAGANIGIVASEIARHAGTTLAFEPNPMAYGVLAHLRARGERAVWAALGLQSGEAVLVVPVSGKGPSSNGGHQRDSRDETNALTYTVPVLALDSLRLDALGFLKIDVEGGEPSVLDGARGTIMRCRPNIMVEHEVSHAGAAFGDVFERLAALNYEGYFLERGTLHHLSAFDPAVQQGAGTRKANGTYVSNFFYLPRGR